MYSKSAWARLERETRIYDMWACNASVKPIATCSDFLSSGTALTDEEQKMKGPLSMLEATEKLIESIKNALYCMASLEYRDRDINDRVLQNIGNTLRISRTKILVKKLSITNILH